MKPAGELAEEVPEEAVEVDVPAADPKQEAPSVSE